MGDYKEFLDDGLYDIHSGLYQNAIDKITQSIKLKDDWEISYFYRAVAHQALEHYDDALIDYAKSISLNHKMTDAYYNSAKIILSRKDIINPDIQLAIKYLHTALEQDDKFIDALFALAAAYKKMAEYEKAITYLDKILEIEPQAVNAKALKKLIKMKYL